MRRPLLVPLLLASAIALAGCAGADPSTGSTTEPDGSTVVDVCATPGGDVVDAVTVSGEFGAVPTVEFDAPLEVDATQRAIVSDGAGPDTTAGETVRAAYTVLNGATGDLIESYGYAEDQVLEVASDPATTFTAFAKALGCVPVGSRVVAVAPASEVFGEAGNPDAGLGEGEALVVVFDVLDVVPTRAWGEDQPAPDGFPTVTLDDDGSPDVVVPDADPPADLRIAVLKKGDGAVVAETDTVKIQYHGVDWESGEMFQESWPTPISNAVAGFVPGFTQALVGQTVGSQVLVVIPPALAYGEAGSSTNELAGKTLVFVIDILGTTAG